MRPVLQVEQPRQAMVSNGRQAEVLGNDRLLFGMILGVLAFWLFAQTKLNIEPTMAQAVRIRTTVMNVAVPIAALFAGMFIVVMGGVGDRVGRVRVVEWGFVLSIIGSLLVDFDLSGTLASMFIVAGR